MLSYRHAFHAGNHGDVLKHMVLVNTLDYLLRKDAPILYIDTHAGAGRYALDHAMARKTAEAAAGVEALDWQRLPEAAQRYQSQIRHYLKQRQYPGSPLLVANQLRKQDRLRLYELHPSDRKTLTRLFQRDRRVRVEASDGFASLKALLPVKQQRALVLMDPSYELKTDYAQVLSSIQEGYRRMPHGLFLIWYPVVQRAQVNQLIKGLVSAGIRDLWQVELGVAADSPGYGMTASGMLLINPPWLLPDQLRGLLPALQQQLAAEQGFSRVEQLVAE